MRLKEILTERVLPFKELSNGVAVFEYSNGREMKIEVKRGRIGPESYEIAFYPVDRSGTDQYAADDAGGDEMSIFQTVIAYVEQWYERNKESIGMIYAEPSINDKYTGKRHRLYTKLAQRMKKKHGGEVKTNGQFVMWYPPSENKDDHQAVAILTKLFQQEEFWDSVADEGSVSKDIGDITFEFDDSNLGILFELNEDSSFTDIIAVNVDTDVFFEALDNGTFEAEFKKAMSKFKVMVKSLVQ